MKPGPGRNEPFPWGEVMRVGLGVLRLSPDDFWAMTPREFAAAASGLSTLRLQPPTRPQIENMMKSFPD